MPPSPTKTSLNVGTSAMMMNYMSDLSCFLKQKCGDLDIFKQFFVSLSSSSSKRMYFCLSLSLFLSFSLFVCVYEVRKVPSSAIRQPYGNGQSLSRRYCTHSGCLFSCA